MTKENRIHKDRIIFYTGRTFRTALLNTYTDDPRVVKPLMNIETDDGKIDFRKLREAYKTIKKNFPEIIEVKFRNDGIIEHKIED